MITNLRSFEKKYRRRHKVRWFSIGFVSILILFGAFITGMKVGSGNWHLNFVRSAVVSNKTLPNELDYSTVNKIYQALKQSYDGSLDVNTLITGLKKGLVNSAGDPYTTYLTADEAKDFNDQLNGSFTGIGAELGKQGSDIIIIAPISGYPADKAGLKPKDVIVSIDGKDTNGLSVDEAVQKIRGEVNTDVKLIVIRNGQERLEFNITRQEITIPSVDSKIVDNNIGYIRISRFGEDTASLVNAAAKDFKTKNVRGIILDLRNDPGGYLNAAVSVSNEWLKDGQTILQEKRGGQVTQTFKAQGNGQLNGIPTIVLINDGSASASEITAGALQDNKVAKVVGVKSFGKGSVQEFDKLSGGDVLKVTIARWYTPNGKNIDKAGIEPDIQQDISSTDAKNSVDSQLNKAITLIKN
jgi:carboxyl-terminal processing protease